MKILILESKLHHYRAKIFDKDKHFPNCDISYGGGRYYYKGNDFFGQYDLIVSTVFTSVTSNLIISKCRSYGIKTLLLSDGVIEWENMYNNEYLEKKGISLYYPIIHEYFGVMGSLEKKYFSELNGNKCISFSPCRIGSTLERSSMTNDFLLTSANTLYLNNDEKKLSFSLYISIFKTLNCMNVSFKTRIFDEELLSEFRKINSDIINDVNCSFDDCISDVSAILTGPSSIVFSAMQKNIPVAQILYRNSPVFTQTGWYINSFSALENTLLSMLTPDIKRLAFQKSVLEDHVELNSAIEQIDFNRSKCFKYDDKEFYMSKYVFNFEPYFRLVDDVIKVVLPRSFIKKWKKILNKYR